ncbi:MAG TPA: response regulator [Anaerolineales bacterium]|nr:response regulator [Anaerolineales bacterium]
MTEKIRVLIVDDVAETRENIRKLLQFESDVEVVGVARTGREAIDQSGELKPDVILMDINMPDMDGISATEAIRRKLSWAQIVILSVQNDQNYMRRAMLAGARDFLTKPPTIDELISAVRRAGIMALEEKSKAAIAQPKLPGSGPLAMGYGAGSGKIITIYSPKGGTGKTTLVANLAVTLQNDETQVAVVDGNLQFGDVTVFFNVQSQNHIGTLTPRVSELDPDVVEDVITTHSESKVKILAAPPKPGEAEDVSGEQFTKLLQYLRRMYAYVIVDTTSSLNEITLAALDVSDLTVLITTQDIPSIANARLFLDLAPALGLSKENILFVMNKYDKRINITPDRIGESLKKEISSVIPLDSSSAIPAMNRGAPFMMDGKAKSQPAGRAILTLAEVIRQRISEIEEQAIESSGIGRL